jgi:hypothetical protein
MADRAEKIASLQAKEVQHRLVQAENAKLERLLKQHEEAVARKNKAQRQAQRQQAQQQKGMQLAWKKKRYRDRLAARHQANRDVHRSPRYRPASSNYMPSSKGGVPLTGPRADKLTASNHVISYSNFSRAERFSWQRAKDSIPGPADYNPDLGNTMEQFAFVDYVQPYAYNDEREAKREQDLKPGILRIQDRADSVVSDRKRLLGRNTKYVAIRKSHETYGKDKELRCQIRNEALRDVDPAKVAANGGMLALENGVSFAASLSSSASSFSGGGDQAGVARQQLSLLESKAGGRATTTTRHNGSEADTVRNLRRQLERVNSRLKRIEDDRRIIIRKFQGNIEQLKVSSLEQEQEMRHVTQNLEKHRQALQSLRMASGDLVGTLLDVSPLFSDGSMKQPFGIIQSKALKMHHVVEDTTESLFDGTRLTRVNTADRNAKLEDQAQLTQFAQHVRQQQIDESTANLDRTTRYREALSPTTMAVLGQVVGAGGRVMQMADMDSDTDDAAGQGFNEDNMPPPPPPPPPSTGGDRSAAPPLPLPIVDMNALSDKSKLDYLFQWGVHHRARNQAAASNLAVGADRGTIGAVEFLRLMRDAGVMQNQFDFNDALRIFAKFAMGSSPSKKRGAMAGQDAALVMSNTGFHEALAAVATLLYPDIQAAGKRTQRFMAGYLIPLAKYHNGNGGVPGSRMSVKQEAHLDALLTHPCVAFLGKHAGALRGMFAQAAGFNQTPSNPDATWREVRQKKLDMSVDQLLVYLQAVELAPKFIKQADLDDAVRCATAGNQLLHGASPSNLNFAQFLEVLGSLAINCFSPERRDEEDEKTFSWSAPLKRLEFVLSHVEGI